MRGFVKYCIYHPVFTWCGVIIFVILGFSSYSALGVTLFPSVDVPFVTVRTTYSGASPNEIEQLVSKPLEDALADLEGIKNMTSYSQDGISLLALEMKSGTDPDFALVNINNKVKSAMYKLPSDVDDPIAMKFDISAQPFLIASFISELPEKETKKYIDDIIKPLISRVEGVGQVGVTGGKDREIQIILDPVALNEYGLTYLDVCLVVAVNNITNPSGYVTQKKNEISLRLVGEFNDVSQLENIIIPTPSGDPIPLSLLGKIVDGETDVRSVARTNSANVVQLRISPRANADIVTGGKEIKKTLTKTAEELEWLEVVYTYDDTGFVESAVKNVVRDTMIGVALTALVIFLFLGRFAATFIVAVSMPVAFIATFIPMQAHGYSLNLMSSLGLALSMGTLVMNSILIIQNIYRYRELGYKPFEASEEGTIEISTSVLAGVLTNLGVFLPVALMTSISGQFLAPYAVTILYATLFSLWVTMSVTPCMAARIKQGSDADETKLPLMSKILTGWWHWLYKGFRDLFLFVLKYVLKFPAVTILVTIGIMYGTLQLGSLIGSEFMPTTDGGTVTIDITLANNASIEETTMKTVQVEDYIKTLPDFNYVRDVVSTIGASDRSNSINKASIAIYLKEEKDRPQTRDFADSIRPFLSKLEGVESAITDTKGVGPSGTPIEIRIKGSDMIAMYAVAEEIKNSGMKIPGIRDLTIETEMGKPELQIEPIRWRLSPLGLNIVNLSSILKGYLIGNVAGKFRQDGFEYDIKAKLDKERVGDIFAVSELPVMTKYGLVPLKEMANVKWGDAPTEIRRINRERVIVISGKVRYITSGQGSALLQAMIDEMKIPKGITATFGGDADIMNQEFAELFKAMGIAIIITFIIVAAIMESWMYAFIILITIPLALIGIVPAMLLTNTSVSLFALIGMIMLIGMVVNNAIVVVDYAENLRSKGKSPAEAIEEACNIRFKSLVMAVTTSVISLVPLAISTGQGSEMRAPIAIVAIGGLIAGGLLALLVIPAAYKVMWKVRSTFVRQPVDAG